MIDHIGPRRTDQAGVNGDFANSHRASAVCARELGRLYDEIDEALTTWHDASLAGELPGDDQLAEAPVVRRSPARCMVQAGPVALTVAWLLRAQRTVADGELLVVVWRGVVGTQSPRRFERSDEPARASSATVVWEQVLTVDAPSEAEWGWAPLGGATDEIPTLPSRAIARLCVERLRAAHAEEGARAR